MSPEEIEKLRPLANSIDHLIEMVMERLVARARENKHDMPSPHREGGLNGAIHPSLRWYSYCRKCVYDIDLDCFISSSGEDKIYVKHTGEVNPCPGRDHAVVIARLY